MVTSTSSTMNAPSDAIKVLEEHLVLEVIVQFCWQSFAVGGLTEADSDGAALPGSVRQSESVVGLSELVGTSEVVRQSRGVGQSEIVG